MGSAFIRKGDYVVEIQSVKIEENLTNEIKGTSNMTTDKNNQSVSRINVNINDIKILYYVDGLIKPQWINGVYYSASGVRRIIYKNIALNAGDVYFNYSDNSAYDYSVPGTKTSQYIPCAISKITYNDIATSGQHIKVVSTTGSITASTSSRTVTGSSTIFLGNVYPGDLLVTDSGNINIVKHVKSNTEIELTDSSLTSVTSDSTWEIHRPEPQFFRIKLDLLYGEEYKT